MVSEGITTWSASKSGWDYVQSFSTAPKTMLYMMTPPIPDPKEIVEIKITVSSHNQGWCTDPGSGLWAWLEALRSVEDHNLSRTEALVSQALTSTLESSEDFADAFLAKGWKLQPLSEDTYSFRIMDAPTTSAYQSQDVIWRPACHQSDCKSPPKRSSPSTRIEKELRMGDRFAFWIRCQV
jgi:hypothetical protein